MRDDEEQQVLPADGALRGSAGASLGQTLVNARTAQSLSVEQLAAALRVEPPVLVALEEERFDALGPAVFVKGYLKLYAQRLSLDYADLLRRYERAAGVEDMPIVHRSGTRWQDKRRSTHVVVVIVLAILIGAAVWLLWANGVVERFVDRSGNGDRPLSGDAAPASATPASATPGMDSRQSSSRTALPQAGLAQEETLSAGLSPGQAGQAVVPPVRMAPASSAPQSAAPETGAEPEPGSAMPEGARAGEALSAPVASDDGLQVDSSTSSGRVPEGHTGLVLSVSGDCWIEISDADGARVYYGLAEAGQTLTLAGRAPLSLVLGNASSVELEVNGQPYPLPAEDVVGNIARFTIASRDGPSPE